MDEQNDYDSQQQHPLYQEGVHSSSSSIELSLEIQRPAEDSVPVQRIYIQLLRRRARTAHDHGGYVHTGAQYPLCFQSGNGKGAVTDAEV